MSTMDRELAAALKLAKTRAMNFAFVSKSPGQGRLIVCKDRINPKMIDEARKQLGGGQILKGRCAGDGNGQVLFETARDPGLGLAKTLKEVITRDTGLRLQVDARKAADVADDALDGSARPPEGAPRDATSGPLAAESKQQAAPSKRDIGRDSTPHAPAPANSPRGGSTVVDSQPPARPRAPGEMTQSEIDAENARVRGHKTTFRPHPGDGQGVTVDKAFAELRQKNGKVIMSASPNFHRNAWQNWLGKTGEPPVAFTLAGRIRIDVEQLTPEQRAVYIELDRAQDIHIKGHSGYPSPKSPPANKTPATPKPTPTHPTTPKSPSPTNTPPALKPLSAQYAEVSKKLGTLSKLGGRFAQGLRILGSSGVQGLLTAAATLLRGLEALDGVESALKGGGFIFRDQVAQAHKLGANVEALVKAYRDAGYHKDLDAMIDLAREIDNQNPDALYGSDALSEFCASVDEDVAKHEAEAGKLLDEMRAISQRVDAGRQLIETLWDDPAFFAAAAITRDDVRIYMAYEDFKKISDMLLGPIVALRAHHTTVQQDLKRINANIIGYFYLDE
jgi:hypothetical protein